MYYKKNSYFYVFLFQALKRAEGGVLQQHILLQLNKKARILYNDYFSFYKKKTKLSFV
jgi:hypothetical protein